MKLSDLIEKLCYIGKDRCLIVLLAGICCVCLSLGTADRQDKKDADAKIKSAQVIGETDGTAKVGGAVDGSDDAGSGESGDTDRYGNEKLSMLQYEEYYAKRLEDFLSQLYGAGSVRVLVTVEESAEQIVARDSPYVRKTEEEKGDGKDRNYTEIQNESNVILAENVQGQKGPIVLKELAPDIKGVIVLAKGADKKSVAMEITCLMEALFGIDSHKIKVAKLSE